MCDSIFWICITSSYNNLELIELTLNGIVLYYTVVRRATGTSDIIGTFIVETSSVNSIITVRNPADNAVALTITPLAGGTNSVSAHLVIMQIVWSE